MQVTNAKKVRISIVKIKDAQGNTAVLKSVPVWQTSDAAILSLVASEDGLSASGVAESTGSVMVSASADGISASVSIDVVAGAAVSFELLVEVVEE